MATNNGIYTWRLYFQERDNKDQRKTQTQRLDVNVQQGERLICNERESGVKV